MSRTNDPTKGAEQHAQKAADQAGAAASDATAAMRDKLSDTASNLRDVGGQVKDAAMEQYGHLRDTAVDYYEQGREKANEWMGDLQGYVQEKPMKALLIAAGVGMLLGIIWKKS